MNSFDVIVIGGGIAALTLASRLAGCARVAVLERGGQPVGQDGEPTSPALTLSFGRPEIQALSLASEPFFTDPRRPLSVSRGLIFLARDDQRAQLCARADRLAPLGRHRWLDPEELGLRLPLLRPGYAVSALMEDRARDIDLAALQAALLERLRRRGARLLSGNEVAALSYAHGSWTLSAQGGSYRAPVVVNAAGAWAGQVAALAGALPLRLAALRRTALRLDPPQDLAAAQLPMVVDAEERFYMKPDAGHLLASPGEEHPGRPDVPVGAETLEVSLCADRLRALSAMRLGPVTAAWTGLRTYAPDRLPVCGFDPGRKGFFWLAGQGASGIQTAPALAGLATDQITGEPGADARRWGADPTRLSPARFA
ncbi:FAD-binding oxidoreductase [Pseudooceanicola sp. CBS1P-1]|uniref:FAD-dependent oxidoreductase n=1 Tax=Pseudooceanicola albus TaxID=2692189 RepID=A0A6L7G7Z6_9RHOB|nr:MULTISPECIES: FAD-binding oxidoreductase [Pseudooceanicola]MBT9385838.1 FAD-binding oxidoreductase [Pseudooceanicola endophyticus]MXN20069.1 FAD-dependent oxidoreductase [Pseudooceanicola albus]